MSSSPLQLLTRIQEDTHLNAAPMPSKNDAEPEWQGIGFQLGGVRLVSPMGEVNELLQLPKITSLPGVKPWVLGISNIRGQLIPIVDLHGFLGMESTMPANLARVLVVQDEDVAAGFLVEQSLGIQHFVLSSFEPPGSDVPQVLAPYVKGVYRHGGRVFYEINLGRILQDPNFYAVAERTADESAPSGASQNFEMDSQEAE